MHTHGDISAYARLPQGNISVNILDMVAMPLRVELRLILQKAERERRERARGRAVAPCLKSCSG